MFRRLLLALLAMGIGVFAASLLRSERAATPSASSRRRPAAGRKATPTGRCTARTRAGAPCSRAAEPGSDRCWQHR